MLTQSDQVLIVDYFQIEFNLFETNAEKDEIIDFFIQKLQILPLSGFILD